MVLTAAKLSVGTSAWSVYVRAEGHVVWPLLSGFRPGQCSTHTICIVCECVCMCVFLSGSLCECVYECVCL